jgi:hypothetical protein
MAEINLKKLTAGGPSDIEVFFNGNSEGDANAQIPLNVNLTDGISPVTPTSVALTGNDLDIEVAPASFDVNLVDRFGNNLGTKSVTANANWDLTTLTPFDYADLYLSRLSTPPSTLIQNAIIQFYDDLITSNVFQNTNGFYIAITTNPTDNSWNLRYPFNNVNSGILNFVGSPSHTTSGIEITSASQAAQTKISPQFLESNDKMISMYINKSITNTSEIVQKFYMGSDLGGAGFYMSCHALNTGSVAIANDSGRTSFGSANLPDTNRNGLFSSGYNASVRNVRRNGNNIIVSGNVPSINSSDYISFGSVTSSDGIAISGSSPIGVRFPYMRVGSYLTGTLETDHYNAVLTFLTTLGIN